MPPDGTTSWTAGASTRAGSAGGGAMLPLFAATLFLSALLLFLVQPVFVKMVLPYFGGSPAVWITAMVFFQAALLAGYLYAHLVVSRFARRSQVLLHLVVLGLAVAVLPIAVVPGWTPPADGSPALSLLGLLAVSVGLPFFAVSATGPLLQKWFAGLNHRASADPYFLYSASNLGSIAALLGFPVVVEPLLRLETQGWVWSAGYGVLTLAIGACAVAFWRRGEPSRGAATADRAGDGTAAGSAAGSAADTAPDARIGWRRRARWVVLAFAPSSLLLGVTQHITTDVAAAPLFWVVPLSLYLLTFVIAFARRPLLRHGWMVALQPFLVLPLALFFWIKSPIGLVMPLHLAAFFVTALVCHGELVRRRPGVRHLTDFYLWLSVGGMLGGVFNALIAPAIFDWTYEYPLALVLACMLRPVGGADQRRWTAMDVAAPALLLIAVLQPAIWADDLLVRAGTTAIVPYIVVLAVAGYAFARRPVRFGLGLGVAILAMAANGTGADTVVRERSFFGVHKVQLDRERGMRQLINGTTVHGAQFTAPERWREPLTYYHRNGPLGQLFAALDGGAGPRRVAAVGLGTGAAACYRREGQTWTFYEIDPVVVRLARDQRYFHYLSECAPAARIVLGDGRLSLERVPDGIYDLMIFDAYSSDTVPVHLMTREALALYLRKLAPDGLLVFHLSNRKLDLTGAMADVIADAGLSGRLQRYRPESGAAGWAETGSDWMVAARDGRDLAVLDGDGRWHTLPREPSNRVWTDDFSNILQAMRWR